MSFLGGFVPRQAMTYDLRLFDIINGSESIAIAKHEVDLIPPFPPGAAVHDAACGSGAVTRSILETSPPGSVKLYATDINPLLVAKFNKAASAGNWPVKAEVMDAQNLAFPDAMFSHSFLSCGLPVIDNPIAAAREMYRTLVPGGTAVTAFWLKTPHGTCAEETRRAIWGPGARLAVEPKAQHRDRAFMRQLLTQSGFEFAEARLYEKSAFLPIKDLDEFARAIWTAVGHPPGGWTVDDEEKWDLAISTYKTLLTQKPGFRVDESGNMWLESVAQICIARKPCSTRPIAELSAVLREE